MILRLFPIALFIFVLSACGGGGGRGSGEFEYVAIGASDAFGIGATPLTNGYVYKIQEGLQADGRDVGLTNLGIPGAKLDEIKDVAVPVAIEDEPELITIFVGANDIIQGVAADSFQADVRNMLADLRAQTAALIVIGNLPNLTVLPTFQEDPDPDVTLERLAVYNNIIATEAAVNGAVLVNLFAEPIESFQVSDDGFHPNDAGHQKLADLYLAAIRPNLPPPAPEQ